MPLRDLKSFLKFHDLRRRWLLLLAVLAVVDIFVIYRLYQNRSEHRYDKLIHEASQRYGIEPALVKAVIWRESSFDPRVRGQAGEVGLMQIREPAAEEWAEAERIIFFSQKRLFDPESNIRAGAWYLSKLLKRYPQTDNPVAYALADYNAGRTHVLQWMQGSGRTNSTEFLAQMDYPGTRRYIQAILNRRLRYRHDFEVPAVKQRSL